MSKQKCSDTEVLMFQCFQDFWGGKKMKNTKLILFREREDGNSEIHARET